MIVENLDRLLPADVAQCDFSFDVTSELVPPYDNPFKQIVPVAAYRKTYGFAAEDFADVGADGMLAVARSAGRVGGYILVSESWNRYALIEDFAVDRGARGTGVGIRLMDRAVEWARQRGLPGLRLETQTNNVPACRFYKRYGFVLGGYDKQLYSALGDRPNEVALFWYLFL